MLKKIDCNNKILKCREFESDLFLFNEYLNGLKNIDIYSDEKNYVCFYNELNHNIYIWSLDNIDELIITEIEEVIGEILKNNDCRIICKKGLYNLLFKSDNINFNDDYNEISYLKCEKVKKPKVCSGDIYIPSIYDVDLISHYYYERNLENNDSKSLDEVKKNVGNLIDQDNSNYSNSAIYGWKNGNNIIVSLAIYKSYFNYATINNVYTTIGNRNKGYASNLLYYITKIILSEGMIPIVSFNNEYVNIYKNIGYINCGCIINTSCTLKNVKNR